MNATTRKSSSKFKVAAVRRLERGTHRVLILSAVLIVLAMTVHDLGAQHVEYRPGGLIDPFLLREDLSIFRITLEEAHPGLQIHDQERA